MKKQYLTVAGIVSVVILAVIFICILLTGTFTVFPTAAIDPVTDHAVGDLVVITGTTNLPAGTRLDLVVFTFPSGSGKSVRAGSTDAYIVRGTGLSNTWSGALDTSGIPPGDYTVNAYSLTTENLTPSRGSLLASSRLRLTGTDLSPSHVSAGDGNRTEYISVNPPGTVVRGEKLLVNGTTNLPNDTELLYMVVQQSDISVFTIDSKTGTQATQAGLTRSGLIGVLPGTGSSNTWSFALDTTEFIPDRYEVVVATTKENQTAKTYDIGNVSGSSFLVVQDVPAGTGA
ncbi:MAG: hypothetical protein PHD55_05935 [Methanoregula sp.]|jgi:predicted metal-dependent enzyme (double-stranded beta helix superfamily)|nr:hypothetical protein [Methanoregula sp.]